MVFVIITFACTKQQSEQPPAAAAAPPVDLPIAGLLAHIPLDGELTVLADSATIRATGAMRWVADRADSASMALELRGGWAIIDSFPLPDTLTSFTVSAWIDGGDGAVLACRDYSLYCVHRRVAFGVPGSEEEYIRARTPLLPGEWCFVAGVYDHPTGMMRLYVNSALEDERYTPLHTSGGRGEALLGYGRLLGDRSSAFTGRVDDIRVWRRALTVDELRRLYSTR